MIDSSDEELVVEEPLQSRQAKRKKVNVAATVPTRSGPPLPPEIGGPQADGQWTFVPSHWVPRQGEGPPSWSGGPPPAWSHE